nr:MAG TPA: hypothetical protein [Caudoviricetes sp.]DAY83062.1 MAG TPA: hypothetical protein [Caudoviricetes sp.]
MYGISSFFMSVVSKSSMLFCYRRPLRLAP